MKHIISLLIPKRNEFTLDLPPGAQLLKVEVIYKRPFLQAIADKDSHSEERRTFRLVHLGETLLSFNDMTFIDSFTENRVGEFGEDEMEIWHLFEVK